MPPEGGIAAADKNIFFASFFGDFIHNGRNLFMGLFCLGFCKASGICQYVKQLVFFCKAFRNAVFRPICVYRNIMDSLHTGRVVVQHNDFLVVLCNFLLQKGVCQGLVNRGIRSKHLCV